LELISIIHTEIEDLPVIRWLLEEAILYQKKNGYVSWTNFDLDVISNDIKENLQYKILIQNEIACVFSVVYSDKAIWKIKENGNALYFHRILVNPKHKGKRLFGKILAWGIQDAKNKARQFIRMDTWADNPTIISYYETFGFKLIKNIITSEDPQLAKQYWNKFLALMEYTI
jgi:hypothetical protein